MQNPTASPDASALAAPPALEATLLRVAWLPVLLGPAMEGILLLPSSGLGEALGAVAKRMKPES